MMVRVASGRSAAFVRLRSRDELAADLDFCAEQDARRRRGEDDAHEERRRERYEALVAAHGQAAVDSILTLCRRRGINPLDR